MYMYINLNHCLSKLWGWKRLISNRPSCLTNIATIKHINVCACKSGLNDFRITYVGHFGRVVDQIKCTGIG